MTRSRTRRHNASPVLSALLGIALTLAFAATLSAQTVSDPRIAEFDPSADHWEILDSGQPAVLRYELAMYLAGAAAPFATVDMGKPNPDSDGKIRFDFARSAGSWPRPSSNFEARVRAVGPEGSALSEPSNLFTLSPCTIALSTSYALVAALGGNYGVGVSTGTGCPWSVTTGLSWVNVLIPGGLGRDTAAFQVRANSSSSNRSGTMTIGGKSLTIIQPGAPAPRTTPVITWATPAPITAGTPLGAGQLNATATVAGTFVYSPVAGTVLPAGNATLTVTFTPADLTRYTTATASRGLVVNPRTPSP
jgi:hypothetical protein